MRRRVAYGALAILGSVMAAAAACNPIFGIVSRSAGPTWCEEKAQVGSPYCDDFDRVPASTLAQETPDIMNGSFEITDAMASSPPNSLEFKSTAAAGTGALAALLVNFGPESATGLVPFHCSMAVRPAELAVAAKGGTVGIAAVGGETRTAQGGNGPAELVFVRVGPDGVTAQLASVNQQGVPAVPKGTPCTLFQQMPVLDKEWVTIQLSMAALDTLDAGRDAGIPLPCPVDKEAGAAQYVLVVQYDAFVSPVLVPREMFAGQPFFSYGIAIAGDSPPVTVHVDDVVCTTPEGGPFGP